MAYRLENSELPYHIGLFECLKPVEEKIQRLLLEATEYEQEEKNSVKVEIESSGNPWKKILSTEISSLSTSKKKRTTTPLSLLKWNVGKDSFPKDYKLDAPSENMPSIEESIPDSYQPPTL